MFKPGYPVALPATIFRQENLKLPCKIETNLSFLIDRRIVICVDPFLHEV